MADAGPKDPKTVFTEQLQGTLKAFSRDRNRHKYLALLLRISTVALSAGATVLLGWQGPGAQAELLKNIALILTAAITLLTAYDSFFEPRKLWTRDTVVVNSLKDLERDWQLRTAKHEPALAEVLEFSGRFHEILKKSLAAWAKGKKA